MTSLDESFHLLVESIAVIIVCIIAIVKYLIYDPIYFLFSLLKSPVSVDKAFSNKTILVSNKYPFIFQWKCLEIL